MPALEGLILSADKQGLEWETLAYGEIPFFPPPILVFPLPLAAVSFPFLAALSPPFSLFSMCCTDALPTLHLMKLSVALIVLRQNRAQSATELLQELNNDVSGNFVEEVCILWSVVVLLVKLCGESVKW